MIYQQFIQEEELNNRKNCKNGKKSEIGKKNIFKDKIELMKERGPKRKH